MTTDDEFTHHQVKHVIEVDPSLMPRGHSEEVNDFLAIPGWVLLNTGTVATRGDNGPASHIYYAVGWIGEGEPQIPEA